MTGGEYIMPGMLDPHMQCCQRLHCRRCLVKATQGVVNAARPFCKDIHVPLHDYVGGVKASIFYQASCLRMHSETISILHIHFLVTTCPCAVVCVQCTLQHM